MELPRLLNKLQIDLKCHIWQEASGTVEILIYHLPIHQYSKTSNCKHISMNVLISVKQLQHGPHVKRYMNIFIIHSWNLDFICILLASFYVSIRFIQVIKLEAASTTMLINSLNYHKLIVFHFELPKNERKRWFFFFFFLNKWYLQVLLDLI